MLLARAQPPLRRDPHDVQDTGPRGRATVRYNINKEQMPQSPEPATRF